MSLSSQVALVQWTESVGLTLVGRDQSSVQLRTPGGHILNFTILQIFPFTYESKRMGIIVRVSGFSCLCESSANTTWITENICPQLCCSSWLSFAVSPTSGYKLVLCFELIASYCWVYLVIHPFPWPYLVVSAVVPWDISSLLIFGPLFKITRSLSFQLLPAAPSRSHFRFIMYPGVGFSCTAPLSAHIGSCRAPLGGMSGWGWVSGQSVSQQCHQPWKYIFGSAVEPPGWCWEGRGSLSISLQLWNRRPWGCWKTLGENFCYKCKVEGDIGGTGGAEELKSECFGCLCAEPRLNSFDNQQRWRVISQVRLLFQESLKPALPAKEIVRVTLSRGTWIVCPLPQWLTQQGGRGAW